MSGVTVSPEPLEPAAVPTRSPDTDNLLSYASAMITALQRDRDRERQAHERTTQTALAQISLLKAQLARRDAELEACIVGHTGLDPDGVLSDGAFKLSEGEQMTPEETLKVLDDTSAKNRRLELEVKGLARKVHLLYSSKTIY